MHQNQCFYVAFKQQKKLDFLCISPSNAEIAHSWQEAQDRLEHLGFVSEMLLLRVYDFFSIKWSGLPFPSFCTPVRTCKKLLGAS
jgi:hypothetical protein